MIRQFHYSSNRKGIVEFDDQDPDLKYLWYPQWPNRDPCKHEVFHGVHNRDECLHDWQRFEVTMDPDMLMDIGL